MSSLTMQIDALIADVPDGSVAVALCLGPAQYAALIDEPTPHVTLAGEARTIHHTYVAECADQLVWRDTIDAAGRTGRAWEVNRAALLTMQAWKRERGIAAYRSVPIERVAWSGMQLRTALVADLLAGVRGG